MATLRLTLIGGPTALLEVDGFRLVTDPTFDPPGEYQLPQMNLIKTVGPALRPANIVPLHFNGWQHFTQSGDDLRVSFDALGFGTRLLMLEPGISTEAPLN
jgi:hypothetical protein